MWNDLKLLTVQWMNQKQFKEQKHFNFICIFEQMCSFCAFFHSVDVIWLWESFLLCGPHTESYRAMRC